MDATVIQSLGRREDNHIYIKRDDLIPVSFGGNKARKAIHFFREIDEGHYNCIVTYGSSSSNHCRIVSNMAAMRNLPCFIINPKEASKPTFNSRMMELFGANIIVVPEQLVHSTIANKLKELKRQGKTPYFIAGGGHGNLGTQAYVDCYEEIRQFEEEQQIHFDYVFFASGTGTTHAGLVCGQLIYKNSRRIVGISIARKNPRGRQVVLDSISEYLNEKHIIISANRIENATIFVDRYTGGGYGENSIVIQRIIRDMLVNYGIPLDSIYTGKAYAGMESYLLEHSIRGQTVLFIHTGGTPLFFDDLSKERRGQTDD